MRLKFQNQPEPNLPENLKALLILKTSINSQNNGIQRLACISVYMFIQFLSTSIKARVVCCYMSEAFHAFKWIGLDTQGKRFSSQFYNDYNVDNPYKWTISKNQFLVSAQLFNNFKLVFAIHPNMHILNYTVFFLDHINI